MVQKETRGKKDAGLKRVKRGTKVSKKDRAEEVRDQYDGVGRCDKMTDERKQDSKCILHNSAYASLCYYVLMYLCPFFPCTLLKMHHIRCACMFEPLFHVFLA